MVPSVNRPRSAPRPLLARLDLGFWLLLIFFAVLWLAGGTSRADMYGQAVTRAAAWVAIFVLALFGRRPLIASQRPVAILLGLAILLAIVQLIPLPESVWLSLPGRAPLAEAAKVIGAAQPPRPIAIVPSLAWNALQSLVVPLTILLLFAGLDEQGRRLSFPLLLGAVLASAIVGLVEFSGIRVNNPLIDGNGSVSGMLANRNHFALLLAIGCALLPAWAFSAHRRPGWRAPVAGALALFLLLLILATGSRAGIVLGIVALVISLIIMRTEVRRSIRGAPRWLVPVIGAAALLVVAAFVVISIGADRAVSIDRLTALTAEDDLRRKALPTILSMIRIYFPIGSGLGGFDPIFRIHEPFDFLNSTYFNRAHDDFLEIAMEAGLPGMLLVAGGLIWWAVASIRVWRAEPNARITRARLGSTIILLTAIASVVDYPARTPMMMAVLTLAACWLSDKGAPYADSAPAEEDHAHRRQRRRRSSSGLRPSR